MAVDFLTDLTKNKVRFDEYVDKYLRNHFIENRGLASSVKYSTLDGGSRVRPLVCMFTARALQKDTDLVLGWALAIELIHCYSLVHDDLPCMDNDDFRRGKPSNHKAYGEGMAVLAGDALNTHAYQVLVDHYKDQPQLCVELVSLLARASGVQGMVGGQALDMNPTLPANLSEMENIFRMKTGALFEASALGSALVCGANETQAESLKSFGASLGVFYQLADDLADAEPSKGVMAVSNREQVLKRCCELIGESQEALRNFGTHGEGLNFLLNRIYEKVIA